MAKKPETEEDFQAVATRHGKATVASMKDDLDALDHSRVCDGTTDAGKPCKCGSETVRRTVNGKPFRQRVHNNPEAWHNEEAALGVIENGHYGIQVRSGWHDLGENPDPEEYIVILGGGGPASRIWGELEDRTPTTAEFEYQDWFKPWTRAELTSEEKDILVQWVSQLSFDGY